MLFISSIRFILCFSQALSAGILNKHFNTLETIQSYSLMAVEQKDLIISISLSHLFTCGHLWHWWPIKNGK
jgi:hypothetical protein